METGSTGSKSEKPTECIFDKENKWLSGVLYLCTQTMQIAKRYVWARAYTAPRRPKIAPVSLLPAQIHGF